MAIYKLGGKKYFIRITKYINKKKRERKFTGELPTMGAAKSKEQELLKELEELKFKEENEELRYTWKKAVAAYLDFSEDNHRLSTFYNRMKLLEAHTRIFNDRDLDSIEKLEIKELIDERGLSISHKKDLLKCIRQVFELAIDNRKIFVNPAKNIKIHGDKSHREKANKLEAMSKTEVTQLLAFMKEINHEWYPIFYVTYQLGLRSSEAVALEFEDIEWGKSHIVISKSWCKHKKGFVPPKNGTSRIVPMNKQLKVFLRELSVKSGGKGFVLPRNKSWMNGGATKILQSIQRQLGIKLTNYHSLRASFITHLLIDGVSIPQVQSLVGHADLKTTMRYVRISGCDLKGVTASLEVDFEPKGRVLSFEKDKS